MKAASEVLAAFRDESGALEDRMLFVRNLGWLLSQTREDIISCELVRLKYEEYVIINYGNNYHRQVNVRLDSYAAIVRDVAMAIR